MNPSPDRVRLKVPMSALDVELAAYLKTVDVANPPRMDIGGGEDAVEAGVFEIADGVRFFPLRVDEEVSMGVIGWTLALSFILGMVAGAVVMGLGAHVTIGVLVMLGTCAGVFVVGMGVSRLQGSSPGPKTTNTGVLITPDTLVIRRSRDAHVIPRDAIETIEERMWEEPGTKNSPPRAHYKGQLAIAGSEEREEITVIHESAQGEVGLSLKPSHPEGRFVGELVRYLVRKWLRA